MGFRDLQEKLEKAASIDSNWPWPVATEKTFFHTVITTGLPTKILCAVSCTAILTMTSLETYQGN